MYTIIGGIIGCIITYFYCMCKNIDCSGGGYASSPGILLVIAGIILGMGIGFGVGLVAIVNGSHIFQKLV